MHYVTWRGVPLTDSPRPYAAEKASRAPLPELCRSTARCARRTKFLDDDSPFATARSTLRSIQPDRRIAASQAIVVRDPVRLQSCEWAHVASHFIDKAMNRRPLLYRSATHVLASANPVGAAMKGSKAIVVSP